MAILVAMAAADWIAVYGAFVATAVAVWQAVTYRRDRRPRVMMRAEHQFIFRGIVVPAGENIAQLFEVTGIRLEVINMGRVKTQLSTLRLSQASPEGFRVREASSEAGFPRWLEPGEAISLDLRRPEGDIFDFELPVDFALTTSTGLHVLLTLGGLNDEIQRRFRWEKLDAKVVLPQEPGQGN